ncbi:hypothetical protein AAFF_G00016470 [Aldrovandia affinis]|uniref:RGM domain family member B n=1 Tax=Aldrovandia affinis TaxID=143900 RepID=A0AAD7WGT9_9TELE|nr:hypothetical protein AAFF_G00016470 [Aldrovandia affinis]
MTVSAVRCFSSCLTMKSFLSSLPLRRTDALSRRWEYYKEEARGRIPGNCRKSTSVSPFEYSSASPQRPGWMGMGKREFYYPGADRLIHPSLLSLMVLVALTSRVQIGECQAPPPQCHIQRCTTDFVSLTSHLGPLDGFLLHAEFCKALRAYSACTRRTSKGCRGNLVFHSATLGISDLMTQRNCSSDGPTSASRPEEAPPDEPCDYHGRHRHAKGAHPPPTCSTCKVEGAWPLIDNDYLSVQVTNVPVVPGSLATATIKITVIFKAYQDCTDQKVYQAVTDDLPAAFTDGTVSGGGGHGRGLGLWIVEMAAEQHVEIHAGYIGTTVVVRQLGRYLTLAARVPSEVAMAFDEAQDLQLCVSGCPADERIDRDGILPLPEPEPEPGPQHRHQHPRPRATRGHSDAPRSIRGFSVQAAMEACREQLEVRDIYFHSCVFDLLTTGDGNFTSATYSALKDMEMLHPARERWRIYPRANAPAHHSLHLRLLLLCSLFLLFL